MIKKHWAQVFLKQQILSILPLKGGKQHQIDLVILVDQSKWVCKRFGQQTWLGFTADLNLMLAEDLAAKAATTLGISFAAYRGEDNNPILNGKAIIIPYCEGKLLSYPSQSQSLKLGSVLAQLHALNLSTENAKPFPPICLPKKNNLPDWLKTMIVNCNLTCQNKAEQFIVSHRDIHMANIVWRTNGNPHLIDWESTGLIHPAVELAGLALNCAGVGDGRFDRACFCAVLTGYNQTQGYLPKLTNHFEWLILHSWLLWYVYCINQGLKVDAEQTLQSILLIRTKTQEIEAIYKHHETN